MLHIIMGANIMVLTVLEVLSGIMELEMQGHCMVINGYQ